MCEDQKISSKVGDTLTAIVLGGADKYTYSWTLNGTVVGATEKYTVPASAVTGDVIIVTVTDEEGNTASDTAVVSGLTIVKVEPTTAAGTNGAGELIGYKYVRIFFSEPLSSLDTSEVEIRGTKNNQLYSLESVKLSSTGLFADVILYGSYDADGTTFLMPNTPYVATIDHDGMVDSLEFELPATAADLVVVSVNADEKTITIDDSGRTQHIVPLGKTEFSIGDTYEGNIGELLGRTVNFEYNADDVITKLTVQDETVVIDTMKYVDPNKNGLDKKDYMVNNSGDKYYFEENNTATKNATNFILANNTSDDFEAAPVGGTDGAVFDYVRLTLNPTGTIATMTFNEDVTDFLMVESVDGTVVVADKNTSMNFDGYAIFNGEALISTDDLEVGNAVYWSVGDNFAYVYAETVTGEMDNVIHEKLDLAGTTYTWTNAKYYDTPNKKYVTLKAGDDAESVASQKYLNSLDPDEVTITLKMNGNIAYVDGDVIGEEETTTTTYIITGEAAQKTVSFDQIVRIPANDGTDKATLDFNPTGLKSVDGKSGKYKTATDDSNFTFTYKDDDGNDQDITKTAATDYVYTELIDITTDNATGAIVGIKELAPVGTPVAIVGTSSDDKINSTTKTVTVGDGTKSYALTASTKVWVVVGGKAAAADDSAASVSMVEFSDFSRGTAAIGTTVDGEATSAFDAYVYPDKANAKHIVIVQKYADANPATGKKTKAWETGETTDLMGVVVGETFVAKSDGSDELVVKTVTIQDAEGTKVTLDADGNISNAVVPGQLIEVTYTNADTKVVAINDALAWSTGTQYGTVEYDSSVIKLNDKKELRPYTACLILKHYTVGGDDHWDPITISEINSSKDGWDVQYHAVSSDGDKKTVDFVIVDDSGITRVVEDAIIAEAAAETDAETAIATAETKFAALPDPTKQAAYETAVADADTAISIYLAFAGTSTSDLTGYTTYNTNKTKYNAAKTAASSLSVTYAATAGSATVTPTLTGTSDWTLALTRGSSDTAGSVAATTGVITFTTDGTVTVSGTATKDGYTATLTITKPNVTMTDFANSKTVTVAD